MNPRLLRIAALVAALAGLGLAGGMAAKTESPRPIAARPSTPPAASAAAALPQQLCGERIVELPDDGRAYYVSIFVHATWRQIKVERELVAVWQTDRTLGSLAAQAHTKVYLPDDPMVRTRYAATLPAVPCVRVQDSTGKVLYQVSGAAVADHAAQREAVASLFPWPCPCPKPKPDDTPKPDIAPDIDVDVDVVPDVGPEPGPAEADFPWVILIGAIAVAAVGTVAYCIAAEIRAR